MGQVAFLTDEAILTYVVKDPKKRDLYNIYQMEKAISKTNILEMKKDRSLLSDGMN